MSSQSNHVQDEKNVLKTQNKQTQAKMTKMSATKSIPDKNQMPVEDVKPQEKKKKLYTPKKKSEPASDDKTLEPEPEPEPNVQSNSKKRSKKLVKSEEADAPEKKQKRSRKSDKSEASTETIEKQEQKSKDESTQKRAPSSFMLFSKRHRDEVKAAHPELKVTEIAIELGKMWKLLSAEQKEEFKVAPQNVEESSSPSVSEKKAKKEKKKAKKEKKSKKDPSAPKRAPSSFMLFSKENRENVKNAHPQLKITEIAVELGKMWALLSADEKKKYSSVSVSVM
jgi:hypothetical protein